MITKIKPRHIRGAREHCLPTAQAAAATHEPASRRGHLAPARPLGPGHAALEEGIPDALHTVGIHRSQLAGVSHGPLPFRPVLVQPARQSWESSLKTLPVFIYVRFPVSVGVPMEPPCEGTLSTLGGGLPRGSDPTSPTEESARGSGHGVAGWSGAWLGLCCWLCAT